MADDESGDVVLRYLMGLGFVERESTFRGTLETVADEPRNPMLRDLVVATAGVLLDAGGVPWPIIMRILSHLKRRSDDDLRGDDAVAIVNGDCLLLPSEGNSIITLDMMTLRERETPTHALVSTIYSLRAIWAQAEEILR